LIFHFHIILSVGSFCFCNISYAFLFISFHPHTQNRNIASFYALCFLFQTPLRYTLLQTWYAFRQNITSQNIVFLFTISMYYCQCLFFLQGPNKAMLFHPT
jgi:hypothetical protein